MTCYSISTADLIHDLAEFIWSEQQKRNTRTTVCDKFLAASLEAAETAADNGEISKAIDCMANASQQAFGIWSKNYANMSRLLGFESLANAELLFGWL